MKAMVLNAPEKLKKEDVADAAADAGEALVRITHSGVCGTDLKIYSGGIPTDYPLIMGHEMIGEVLEPGEASGISRGDRVIIDPVFFCGTCYQCRNDQEHICANGGFYGRDRNGGFAEVMAAPPDAIFKLPESIGGPSAALIQVMTTCLHGQRLIDIFPGEVVVITGLGVAGLLHVQLARARGARVIGVTRSPARREMAQKLGAEIALEPGGAAKEKILQITDGRGADVVIESAGALPVLAQAIDYARIGGRLLLFGIYTGKEAELPFYQLYFKELAVISARAAKRQDYPASIDLVSRGIVDLDSMITHVLPLDELEQAITMLAERDDHRLKVILEH